METDLLKSIVRGNSLWVFAYGSLLWKPCIHYHTQVVGHIKGFKRRFFQGNTNLRGTIVQPGRVAVIIPDSEEVTWGVAYQVSGKQHIQHAIEHLYLRENTCGDYQALLVNFFPRASSQGAPCASSDDDSDRDDDSVVPEPFLVLSFTATPSSTQYLGPADIKTMAVQVVAARGTAGSNSDYVLKTAEYVRLHIPEDRDRHLFELEAAIRKRLVQTRKHKLAAPV